MSTIGRLGHYNLGHYNAEIFLPRRNNSLRSSNFPLASLANFTPVCKAKKCDEDDLAKVLKKGGVPRSKWSEEFADLLIMLYAGKYHDMLHRALVKAGMEEAKVKSIAEAWLEEGEARGVARGVARGEARGEAKGLAEAVLLQVRQKFKRVSKQREAQVRSASMEQLKDWLARILEAPDLETVFGSSRGSRRQPQG